MIPGISMLNWERDVYCSQALGWAERYSLLTKSSYQFCLYQNCLFWTYFYPTLQSWSALFWRMNHSYFSKPISVNESTVVHRGHACTESWLALTFECCLLCRTDLQASYALWYSVRQCYVRARNQKGFCSTPANPDITSKLISRLPSFHQAQTFP